MQYSNKTIQDINIFSKILTKWLGWFKGRFAVGVDIVKPGTNRRRRRFIGVIITLYLKTERAAQHTDIKAQINQIYSPIINVQEEHKEHRQDTQSECDFVWY